jgi:hypothetical protein
VTCLCWQHTDGAIGRTFDGREEFLDEVRRKGAKLGKIMIYEKKKKMREKYLKEPPGWILGIIKRELNLSEFKGDEGLEELNDRHDTALTYWRQNRRQYPPERVWNKFYLICYISILSQDMSYGLGVWQGQSN